MTVAVLVSLLVSDAAWRPMRPVRPVLVVGAVFCLGAALFGLREVVHQVDQGRTGVALIAGAVLLLHLGRGS